MEPKNLYKVSGMMKLAKTSLFWGQTQLKSHELDFEFSSHFRSDFSTQIRKHQTLIASNGHFVSNL
jgi:hypothetical protein